VPPSAETAGTGPAAPTISQGVATVSVVAPFELRPRGAPPVRVRLEVAATPAQRSLGLMHRTTLPEGTGMVFLFPEDREGGFWMKNTLVPLSIAFVRADGRVVAVREMVPCTADPCPVYRPGGRYRYAVELPAGAFADAGVGPGDRVVAVDPRALPAPS
jgi:uncharacterized protein